MANASDIRNGLTIKYNDDIYKVISFQQVKQARSAGFYRTKLKSLTTGKVIENNFNSSAKIDTVRVERRYFQYLYAEGDMLVFMDTETYEQININREVIDGVQFLKEGDTCEVLFNTETDLPLTVEMQESVILEITYAEPGLRGDTATNTLKPAKVETGAEVRVPLFINEGDKVKINTLTGEYMERVKE
jgi:elongation factor P